MFHGRTNLDQRVLSGVDLAIDFATLGEYGLVPYTAAGSCRKPTDRRPRPSRRPGWEALATIRRGACGTSKSFDFAGPHLGAAGPRPAAGEWGFPTRARRADFRAAVERYAR